MKFKGPILILPISLLLTTAILLVAKRYIWTGNNRAGYLICAQLDTIISSSNLDFKPIKGRVTEINRGDTDFDSKIHIPNSNYNNLSFSADEVPSFITTLYQGTDSIEAFNRYLQCNSQFMECYPAWKLADKEKYEKLDASNYAVYTFEDKLVYISFSRESHKKEFTSILYVTTDPDNKFYDKNHHLASE